MGPVRDVILEMRGVNKTFKDFWLRPRVKAVQDMDLTVRRGEVIGLLGPNGSGKTTAIKMVLGLLYPTSGAIAVMGKRPTDVKLKERIGYLPEESHPYRFLNAEETLDFYARLFHIPRAERAGRIEALLDMVGLTAARFRPTGEYSKGMQRRVGLAQALINDPDLLILDEPTTGMDPIATRQIKDLILTLKKRGKTIVLCTHLLGEVEDVCDRLIIMYGGKIRAEGAVDSLLTVDGKQAIEVEAGEPISRETVQRIEQLLSREGKRVAGIRVPRQRLETLFMDVIQKATAAGEVTTGAAVGGEVAEFLALEQAEGQDLLERLAGGAKPEIVQPEEPADSSPVPEPTQPDAAVLDEMASTAPVAQDTPFEEPARATGEAQKGDSDADEQYLRDLAGKRQ